MHWVYYVGRFLSRVILYSMSSWRVTGRENLPDRGPYMVVCNHLHVVDPPIIAVSVPLDTVIMAKGELFESRFNRFFVKNFGSFPVRRGIADRHAFREATQWVRRGFSLIMFPEGRRTRTIQMQAALPGPARIAARLGIPILPVSITGTERLRESSWWLRRPRITVSIGKPIPLPQDGRKTREETDTLTRNMMESIARLLPPEYRGAYGSEEARQHEDRESG